MPERKSIRTDVLIVGSGAVGVAAGLEAHEAGAQVVVIEKEAHLGGAAALSGGGCSCVGTQLQREHGIADSPDLAFEDWITWGEGAADEAWARFYIEHSDADLYQWGIEHSVQWDALNQQETACHADTLILSRLDMRRGGPSRQPARARLVHGACLAE